MKIFLTILALFACTIGTYAQSYIFDKGVMAVGGNVGFNSTSGGSTTITQFNLSPTFGYFVSKNLLIGAALSVNSISTSVDIGGVSQSSSSSSTFIGPFVRYYFTDGRPILTPYIGGQIGINSGGGSSDTRFGVEGGLAYVLAKNITAEAGLGFTKIEGGSIIGLNVGIGAYLW